MSALKTYIEQRLLEEKVTIPPLLLKAVVDELAYAMEPHIHEGLSSTYGAVITNDINLLSFDGGIYSGRKVILGTDAEMRYIADGIRSFYCPHIPNNNSNNATVWISESIPFDSEVKLFSLRDEVVFVIPKLSPHNTPKKDLLLVQRNHCGDVTLMCTSGIILIKGGVQWSRRMYQYDLKLEEYCTNAIMSSECTLSVIEDTYRSLARLALHILGARRIGATLIVMDTAESPTETKHIRSTNTISVKGANLSLRNKGHQELISHLLQHTDGAAIFSYNGTLLSIRNWLLDSKEISQQDIDDNPGGARQLSAKLASKHLNLPVITVSSDGPVRAFYKGNQILGDDMTVSH